MTPNPLIIARNRVGANTAEGELYSRMIETDLAYRKESDPGARAHLRQFMGWCRDRLASRVTNGK